MVFKVLKKCDETSGTSRRRPGLHRDAKYVLMLSTYMRTYLNAYFSLSGNGLRRSRISAHRQRMDLNETGTDAGAIP